MAFRAANVQMQDVHTSHVVANGFVRIGSGDGRYMRLSGELLPCHISVRKRLLARRYLQELTGLNAAEINHVYKRFRAIDPLKFMEDNMGRIPYTEVADKLKELKCNPFRYRIAKVFTSSESGFMIFDDFLEMAAVMSDKASLSTKLIWAFRIFGKFKALFEACELCRFHEDSNEDGKLCKDDLNVFLDALSYKKLDQDLKDRLIDEVKLYNCILIIFIPVLHSDLRPTRLPSPVIMPFYWLRC